MEGKESHEKLEDFTAIIREEIENAPEFIQAEIDRGSGNNWLACLVTRLQVVLGNAELAERNSQLSADKLQRIEDIIHGINTEITAYQNNLAVADNPPDEVKNGLLAEFSSILEVL